jgi:aspartate carbamoyltransferase catalytic subunit
MTKLSVRHLLGIKNLNENDIQTILDTATQFKEVINRPIKKVPSLRDITIANVFFENSTRTRLSFELAEKRLSADVVNFSASGSSVKKGETLLDTVNNILAMKVDMIVMRHSSPGAPHYLSSAHSCQCSQRRRRHTRTSYPGITRCVFNAGEIRRSYRKKNCNYRRHYAFEGCAYPIFFVCKSLGAEVMVCGPSTLIPKHLGELGVKIGHNVRGSIGVV